MFYLRFNFRPKKLYYSFTKIIISLQIVSSIYRHYKCTGLHQCFKLVGKTCFSKFFPQLLHATFSAWVFPMHTSLSLIAIWRLTNFIKLNSSSLHFQSKRKRCIFSGGLRLRLPTIQSNAIDSRIRNSNLNCWRVWSYFVRQSTWKCYYTLLEDKILYNNKVFFIKLKVNISEIKLYFV